MLDVIKEKYKHVEDIDLLAGLWVELPATGSFLPKTLQYLMLEQHFRFLVSDRHWYERPNRPHAFNLGMNSNNYIYYYHDYYIPSYTL